MRKMCYAPWGHYKIAESDFILKIKIPDFDKATFRGSIWYLKKQKKNL